MFSYPDAAADLIRSVLPREITETLDLVGLTVRQESFVAADLRAAHSDLLLQVPRLGPGEDNVLVYVLVEHKSRPDRWTLLQLLGYMVEIWKRYRRDHPNESRLPAIVPVVFSHSRKRWRYSLDFSSLVAIQSEQEQRHTPSFTVALYETAGKAPEQVRGGIRFVSAVRALHFRRRMIRRLPSLIRDVRDTLTDEHEIRELLDAVLAYLSLIAPNDAKDLREAVLVTAYRPAEETMKTIAEQWMEQGQRTGRIEEKKATLIRQLDRKFGLNAHERDFVSGVSDPDVLDVAVDALIDNAEKDAILMLMREGNSEH